ncbi:MAG: RNA polymerase sigma-70 factor [Chloroflexi bacterium]|nr:RNA polymerase sigma-70 factor [Chloroflexota bacterium]
MNCTEVFNDHRNLLFSIAYRMLGLVMDAEDMVQECFIKWHDACDDDVDSPKSFLATMVTRLCIDYLRSARVKREEYIGSWLPEPILTGDDSPEKQVTQTDHLSTAFMVMLERLSPIERAVFLLREVFDYNYTEIATIVDKSEANCRQILRRARQHIDEEQARYEPDMAVQQQILDQFVQLTATGDLEGLIALLSEDVVVVGDGGGKAIAARRPIIGAETVAKFFIGLAEKQMKAYKDPRFEFREVNGQLSIVFLSEDVVYFVTTVAYDASGKIKNIYSQLNPDKLRHLN